MTSLQNPISCIIYIPLILISLGRQLSQFFWRTSVEDVFQTIISIIICVPLILINVGWKLIRFFCR